jgi:replicative DNA helicase
VGSLSNKDIELKLLGALLVEPFHMLAIQLPEAICHFSDHKCLFSLIQAYVKKYHQPPTKGVLIDFAESNANTLNKDVVINGLKVLNSIVETPRQEIQYYIDQAKNLLQGRQLFNVVEKVHDKMLVETDYVSINQEAFNALLKNTAVQHAGIDRGDVWENIKYQYEFYQDIKNGIDRYKSIPFGIKVLDEVTGGTAKTFLSMFVGKTGGGKSRMLMNIGVNAAMSGKKVMYISLEMIRDDVSRMVMSRIASLDVNQLKSGKLSLEDELIYKEILKELARKKFPFNIVDIQNRATPTTIISELELYKNSHGCYPDMLIIDYAGIMDSDDRYVGGRSEKYDVIFRQLHQMAKYFDIAIITAMQESRTAQQNEKKKKETESDDGVLAIGLSHYVATHCEQVFRLVQDDDDHAANRIWVQVSKNRWGQLNNGILLRCDYARSFIGDPDSSVPQP